MSQDDIIAWLRKHPGWHLTADVVSGLGHGYTGVRQSLAKASAWRDIESRKA